MPPPDVAFKFGAFADFGVDKLQFSLNLVALNFPVGGGNNYLTQGVGVGLKNTPLFGVPLAVGIDRQSNDGGLSWENNNWSGSSDKYSASADNGIGFDAGLGAGISVSHLEKVVNFFVSCAH
jgi:hypothetical protein